MKKNIYNILQIIARRASRHRLLQAFRLLCPVHSSLSFCLLPLVLLSTVPYATVYASTGLGFILEPVTVNDVPAAVMDVAQVESAPAASVLAGAVAKPVVVSQPKAHGEKREGYDL